MAHVTRRIWTRAPAASGTDPNSPHERRRRLAGLLLAVAALVAAVALLATNPRLLVGLSSDREGQALLPVSTLGPASATTGGLILTNEGILPLRYQVRVTGSAEQARAGVIMRIRRNDETNYIYQGPVLTQRPIPLGVLLPGTSTRLQVTLVAPYTPSTASIPVDDTFTWTAQSPGFDTWWWLLVLALVLAAAAFLLPRAVDLWARLRALPRPRFELVWRAPLALALVVLAALIPLNGVSLASVNSQSSNPANLFAIGALVLNDADHSATTCMSVSSGSVAGPPRDCSAIFQFTQGSPGQSGSAQVTIRNVGTVPVNHFLVWSPNPCRTQTASELHGTGDVCSAIRMRVHDDSHDACFYPVRQAGACPVAAPGTMADFGRRYPPATPLELRPDGLGAGITFTFTVDVDPHAGNDMQGLAPYLDFQWEVSQ